MLPILGHKVGGIRPPVSLRANEQGMYLFANVNSHGNLCCVTGSGSASFGKPYPNSHQSGKSGTNPYEREKPDRVPNLLQSKQTEALKAHNIAIQEQETRKI